MAGDIDNPTEAGRIQATNIRRSMNIRLGSSALLLFLGMIGAPDRTEATETFSDCENCPTMVVIPAGSTVIGSEPHALYRRQGERPRQRITIAAPFAMAQTEVTLAQYRVFVSETGHKGVLPVLDGKPLVGCNYFDGASYGFVSRHDWQNPGVPQREDEPVLCVSWSDANAYAEWLSNKTGRAYRVPSTSEFEYALRAGSDTAWFWGNDAGEACRFANVADRAFARRFPERPTFGCNDRFIYATGVASFEANPFGLYDMYGNAWEWTNDCWHDDLTDAPLDGSTWLDADGGDCTARTPKGGGWLSGPEWLRPAVRSKDGQHYRSFMLGFRVAAEYVSE
jgi:formylglycine-generating enzyme required for sulfatase activity